MKKTILILIMSLLSFSNIYSQKFYVKLHSGYAIGTSPRGFYQYSEKLNDTQTISTTEVKNFSFGEGINFSGAAGYFINPNIGCDLELQYSMSSDLELISNNSGVNNSGKDNQILSSTAFMIIPTLFVSTEISSFKPYLKIGPIIAFPSIKNSISYDYSGLNGDNTSFNSKTEREIQLDGGTAIGINSTLGISYKLGSSLALVFEVNNKSLSYSPEKGEVKKYKLNGVSVIEELNRNSREIEYVDSETYPGNNNPDKPAQALKTQYSFSSLAFSLGLSLTL